MSPDDLINPVDLCRSLTVSPAAGPEVVADDTPAVQAVLKADTRRLKLLDEEKRLQARLEKGDDSVGDRLEKVRQPTGRRPLMTDSNRFRGI